MHNLDSANRHSLVSWLISGVRDELRSSRYFCNCVIVSVSCGVALSRASLHLRVHHPPGSARECLGQGSQASGYHHDRLDVEATDAFLRSPFRVVIKSGVEIRQRLQIYGPHQLSLSSKN